MRFVLLLGAASSISVLAAASGLHAQTPRGLEAPPEAGELVDRADRLHARHQPRDALELYRSVLEREPDHHDALMGGARAARDLGLLAPEEGRADRWLHEAEELARRAVEENPSGTEGRYRLAVVLSERAAREDPRDRIRLSREVHEHARALLERDSLHPGAHWVLGRWHTDVQRMRSFTRFIARRLPGGEVLEEASWDDALQHLERAVELAPERLEPRMALADAYLELERPDEAREQLREILERPTLEPVDPQLKQRAQELLKAGS